MDLTSITGALAGIKTILDIGKTVGDPKIQVEINVAVSNIQVKLIEAPQQIIDVQEENRGLRERLRGIEDEKTFRDGLIFGDGVYCSACLDIDGKKVRPSIPVGEDAFYCAVHGNRD